MKRFLGNRGQLSFFFIFVVLAISLLVLFAVAIPSMIEFDTKLYAVSEGFMTRSIATANTISDANVRTALVGSMTSARDTIPTQITVFSEFFKYGWILIIAIIVIVLIVYARRQVEYQNSTGLV